MCNSLRRSGRYNLLIFFVIAVFLCKGAVLPGVSFTLQRSGNGQMIISKATNFAVHCQCFMQLSVGLFQVRICFLPQAVFPSIPLCNEIFL